MSMLILKCKLCGETHTDAADTGTEDWPRSKEQALLHALAQTALHGCKKGQFGVSEVIGIK